ncbi:MAG: sensor histidine kinase [Syntrophobacteraceae bacterium]
MNQAILLVDDEDGIRNVLGIALADSGYEVLAAASGEEALRLFRSHAPLLILTDIKMPGMGGIELLKKIKEESTDAQVIMMTGHGDMDLAVKSLQCDAADFITKPINDEALDVALKRARERIELKRKLREYTEGLERMVQEKTQDLLAAERLASVGQTVATLAHSIKNIIGGLKGGIFVLEKGLELGKREYVDEGWRMTRTNVDKIKSLALDLLNYAKEREPILSRCNPNEPIREVFHLMAVKADEACVKLTLSVADDLKPVWMDSEAIHCCLLNLVANALDACLDIACTASEKSVVLASRKADGWAVEYSVTDNGCGMDEVTREKILKGFYSTKGSRGTGLGLMIAQKIVAEHGGTMRVETEEGKGATFIVRLPVIAEPPGS